MDVSIAAFNVVHDYRPGGASVLGPMIGVAGVTLSHQVKGTVGNKLGLLDSVKLSLITGDMRILEAFAAECGRMTVPLPDSAQAEGDDCVRRLGELSGEFSALCAEVLKDVADGQISDNELARMQRLAGQLVAGLSTLMRACSARNQAGKPAFERA